MIAYSYALATRVGAHSHACAYSALSPAFRFDRGPPLSVHMATAPSSEQVASTPKSNGPLHGPVALQFILYATRQDGPETPQEPRTQSSPIERLLHVHLPAQTTSLTEECALTHA